MVPGVGEWIENVVHFIETGHSAHAFDDADHQREGAEHGCSGTHHVCSCCQSPTFVGPKLGAGLTPAQFVEVALPTPSDDGLAEGVPVSVFRPPIA
jgi:hypothetical protein